MLEPDREIWQYIYRKCNFIFLAILGKKAKLPILVKKKAGLWGMRVVNIIKIWNIQCQIYPLEMYLTQIYPLEMYRVYELT
jgi:hypothetical protein